MYSAHSIKSEKEEEEDDFIYCISNYWRNYNITRLVTAKSQNLRPRPTYVIIRDLIELHAKFDHNRSKTVTPIRY